MRCINKIQLLALILILAGNMNAQLPAFTLLDTGAIYEHRAGKKNASAVLLDADNDGDLDPVIGDAYFLTQLELYRNERENIYRPEIFLPEYSKAFPVRYPSPIGDIDNDGDIDVVGHVRTSRKFGVFFNDGYGNFVSDTTFDIPHQIECLSPVLLDFNKDGYLDLLRFDPTVVVLYNDWKGVFGNQTNIGEYEKLAGYVLQHSLSWADADNDGDMDVYCGMTFGKNVFFINTGTGLEKVEENHITLSETGTGDTPSVNWIDYDNDGDMDLYTLDVIYENLGNLEFEKHVIVDEKYDSDSVWTSSRVWGDLDNDGDLDLFLSVENNRKFGDGLPSAYPYNLLYLNEGNGEFTNVLDHILTQEDSHTAKIFDQDNDGDLDVLTIGNGWVNNGNNMLYINEGNGNSSVLINCIDKFGCVTPYGTRLYAKTLINGNYVSQMREITPVDGNQSYANTRIHFGLGDAKVLDSLIIRWPLGHVDTFLNVPTNQFYLAIEDSVLEIDYKATNYIQLNPVFTDVQLSDTLKSVNIDLTNHYKLISGDTIPVIVGDTLEFELISTDTSNVASASLEGSILTLNAGTIEGTTTIKVIASAGFTRRMDQFYVSSDVVLTRPTKIEQSLKIFPNPAVSTITIETESPDQYSLEITSLNGQQIFIGEMEGTSHQIDLSSLQKGVYLITIRSEDFVISKKIIKL